MTLKVAAATVNPGARMADLPIDGQGQTMRTKLIWKTLAVALASTSVMAGLPNAQAVGDIDTTVDTTVETGCTATDSCSRVNKACEQADACAGGYGGDGGDGGDGG